jgi:release factor glutamine methyltransferase
MHTLVEILKRTEAYFKSKDIASPRLDAELLIGHAMGMGRVQLYMRFDMPMEEDDLDKLRALVLRRGEREPLAYILGSKGFYEHDFHVASGVLCPRPDTEALVEAALAFIPEDSEVFVADVGCGTGCIGLSLAAARPMLKLYATDISGAALDCAKKNVAALGLEQRAAILSGSLLSPIPTTRRIDYVVSNPPYIPSGALAGLEPEVSRHEPKEALDGGLDGLDVYRALVPAAAHRAAHGVLVEVGVGQASAVARLMSECGLQTAVRKDLSGIDRVVVGLKGRSPIQ